jgi:hypothetical protein
MRTVRTACLLPIAILAVACVSKKEKARTDSLRAITEEQLELTTTLSAQKDSLTRIIIDADGFIMNIDSQIRTVKGLPAGKRVRQKPESPLEEQVERRKEVMARVAALVDRAKTTATQLNASREREKTLLGEKEALEKERESLQQQLADATQRMSDDESMVAELGETIERQQERIMELESRIDTLIAESTTIAKTHYRAYYVVGTEDELIEKGIIEREGGANLIIARPGRTLTPARGLNPTLFIPIDQREVREIAVPDTTKRYRIISRQSLDNAEVRERDKTTFTGNLRIANSEQFWASSRYLILVQR